MEPQGKIRLGKNLKASHYKLLSMVSCCGVDSVRSCERHKESWIRTFTEEAFLMDHMFITNCVTKP